MLGGLDALAKAPGLVIGERYATGSSLSQALGFATVAAFDSGNLLPVAKAPHEKYQDKPMVIGGADDKHLEAIQGVNLGRSKTEEAGRAVGGKWLLRIFVPGEQAANPKGFTDFNDLATRSALVSTAAKNRGNLAAPKNRARKLPAWSRVKGGRQPGAANPWRGGRTGTLGHGCERGIFALTAMPTRAFRRQIPAVSHRRQQLGQEGVARQVRSVVDDVIEWQRGRSGQELQRGQRQEQGRRLSR